MASLARVREGPQALAAAVPGTGTRPCLWRRGSELRGALAPILHRLPRERGSPPSVSHGAGGFKCPLRHLLGAGGLLEALARVFAHSCWRGGLVISLRTLSPSAVALVMGTSVQSHPREEGDAWEGGAWGKGSGPQPRLPCGTAGSRKAGVWPSGAGPACLSWGTCPTGGLESGLEPCRGETTRLPLVVSLIGAGEGNGHLFWPGLGLPSPPPLTVSSCRRRLFCVYFIVCVLSGPGC